jgi:hypothetical protein
MVSSAGQAWGQGSATGRGRARTRPAGDGNTPAKTDTSQLTGDTKAATKPAGGGKKDDSYKAKPTPNPEYPLLPAVIYTPDNAPATPKVADLPLKESVSQYGITWTFDKPAPVGQFVNGDWYVVGEATVKMIDPKPLFGAEVKDPLDKGELKESAMADKIARNGSTLNAVPKKPGDKGYNRAGFDSRVSGGRYNPDDFTPLPIKMVPGDSLISTISRENEQLTAWDAQHIDSTLVAAVLTCMAEPQPADAFRPSYSDTKNCKAYLARNLKRELLLKLPKPVASSPRDNPPANLDGYARMFQKPWIDLADFGFMAPYLNLPHYGQNMSQEEGEASLLLLTDYTPAQKEPLLINLVQVGIDFYGVARAGFVWHAHGGLYSGRKWPILLAGVMLCDEDMQSPAKKLPALAFHEDDQTAMGPVTVRGHTYDKSWSGSRAIFMGHSPYLTNTMKDHWEKGWGVIDVIAPAEWPKRPDGGNVLASEGYRRANTSMSWVGTALAVRMMHLEKMWDHEAFFAYMDRWMAEDDTKLNQAMKDAGWIDYTHTPAGRSGRQGAIGGPGWIRDMWTKYRNNLPPAKDGSKTPNDTETWK